MVVEAKKQFCLHVSNRVDGDTTQWDKEYRKNISDRERWICEYSAFEDFPRGPVAMTLTQKPGFNPWSGK